jgi:4-hydroxybenzoate polyprenyltransferase
MKKFPLSIYVIGVIVVLVIVNYVSWMVGGEARLKSVELFSGGFWLGMLAMYIAVHIYRWK